VFARADHVAPLFATIAAPPPTDALAAGVSLIEYVDPASDES
jgi:hypothetical protein